MCDGEHDGVGDCPYFDFLQLAGVAGVGDISVNSKCHIFAILLQRYGTFRVQEKTGLGLFHFFNVKHLFYPFIL